MEKIKNKFKILIDVGITLGIFIGCTAICFLLDYFKVNDLNFLIIYVLGILLSAIFTNGFVYSSALSVVCVLGYNYFFTVPRFSLKINDPMYLVTFILMVAAGLGISSITYQLKKRMTQVAALNIERIKLKTEAQMEQARATLLRSISHDLRTPLTTVKNGAELIHDCPDLAAEDKDEILSDIISKSDWTIRLVENLLSLTRIDSEKLTVKKQNEAIEEIVPQAVRNVSGIKADRKIHYDMPEDILLAPMDATLIIQVISNILSNSIKHSSENGNIWIKVFCTGKSVVFRISNDGAPIREDDLPHIFEMYFTTGDTNDEGSTGLGLAICKLIVDAHGGAIEARNGDNKVIFEFSLPMEDNNAAHINH